MDNADSKIAEAYDAPPLWYDIWGLFILWLTYKSRLISQVLFFSQFNRSKTHLEVAIGSGSLFQICYWWARLKNSEPISVIGFDYAPSMLSGAFKRFKNVKTIELLIADATKMPFESNRFETVHVANAIHSIPNYPQAVLEMARVIRPGGLLRMNVLLPPSGFLKSVSERINKWGARKGILQAPIPREEIFERLRFVGFEIVSEKTEGNCLFVLARKVSTKNEFQSRHSI